MKRGKIQRRIRKGENKKKKSQRREEERHIDEDETDKREKERKQVALFPSLCLTLSVSTSCIVERCSRTNAITSSFIFAGEKRTILFLIERP